MRARQVNIGVSADFVAIQQVMTNAAETVQFNFASVNLLIAQEKTSFSQSMAERVSFKILFFCIFQGKVYPAIHYCGMCGLSEGFRGVMGSTFSQAIFETVDNFPALQQYCLNAGMSFVAVNQISFKFIT